MFAKGVLAILFVAFAVTFDYSVLARSNWQARPRALIFPVIGALALVGLAIGVHRKRHDAVPFATVVVFFLAAFLSLGAMFWRYTIPYSITIASAAAPDASLQSQCYGGVVVLPVIAIDTIGV